VGSARRAATTSRLADHAQPAQQVAQHAQLGVVEHRAQVAIGLPA
jgi:hypothetical protein